MVSTDLFIFTYDVTHLQLLAQKEILMVYTLDLPRSAYVIMTAQPFALSFVMHPGKRDKDSDSGAGIVDMVTLQ